MKIILASNSPRRKELLAEAGFQFSVVSSDYDEVAFTSDPVLTATEFAKGKATDVFNRLKNADEYIVIGADTVVYNLGKILNKPSGDEEATKMLKSLSGRTHSVITGYFIKTKGRSYSGHVETRVTFNELSEETINSYVKSGLYKGKSGSYGIQDPYPLVKSFEGSLNNVIGFPTETIVPILNDILVK